MCWQICGSDAQGVAHECMTFAHPRHWWPRPVSRPRAISYPREILRETVRARVQPGWMTRTWLNSSAPRDATAFFTGNTNVAKLVKKFRIDEFKGVGGSTYYRRAYIGPTLTRNFFGADCREGQFGSNF